MDQELMDLCTKKCVQKNDIKSADELTIPQRSCFHRCSIKFMEAMSFTVDQLNFQTYEIKKENAIV